MDGITPSGHVAQSTFHRGLQQSCIDYIFITQDLFACKTVGQVNYVQPSWSDHFLLSLRLQFSSGMTSNNVKTIGKGLWRAHPRLAADSSFCDRLAAALSSTAESLDHQLPVTEKWDILKSTVQRVAKDHSRRKAFNLQRAETLLQKKRRGILSQLSTHPENTTVLTPQLSVVEFQLADIQQYHVETLAIRSGIRWKELGELSPGYLKRTVASRSAKQLIPPLLHPVHRTLSSTKDDMLNAACTYYSELYSPAPIHQPAVDELLSAIPSESHLSAVAQACLIAPITFDDLLYGFSRSPKHSSPGTDGLPYEVLCLMISHPACREIALAVLTVH
jgi:hypothetical protein